MIYTNKFAVAFQRKDKYYRFISTHGWYPLDHEIRNVDRAYTPIGPTILVEWEE